MAEEMNAPKETTTGEGAAGEQVAVIAYCVKCREKREMKDAKEIQMKGKGGPRRAMKGVCAVCGTGMFKILGKA